MNAIYLNFYEGFSIRHQDVARTHPVLVFLTRNLAKPFRVKVTAGMPQTL